MHLLTIIFANLHLWFMNHVTYMRQTVSHCNLTRQAIGSTDKLLEVGNRYHLLKLLGPDPALVVLVRHTNFLRSKVPFMAESGYYKPLC